MKINEYGDLLPHEFSGKKELQSFTRGIIFFFREIKESTEKITFFQP